MFTTYMNEALAEATKALERVPSVLSLLEVREISLPAGNETLGRLDPSPA